MIRGLLLVLPLVAAAGCSHSTPFIAASAEATAESGLRVEDDAVRARLLLVGDAGAPAPDEPVLRELTRWGAALSERTTIVFLGDNIYPRGLVEESDRLHEITSWRLRMQIDAVRESGARAVFVPGNHDWAHGGRHGLQTLLRQEQAVVAALGPGSFLPAGGCGGPAAVDLAGLRLVIFDSQRLIQKPPVPCSRTERGIIRQIERLTQAAGEREVIVVGHHPVASYGPHGSFADWRDHLFPLTNLWSWAYLPLPVVGSLYPLVRNSLGPSSQDIGHERYQEMIDAINEALLDEKPLAYAAAHDHSLQVLTGDEAFEHVLVSGAGSITKITKVGSGSDTLFAHAEAGFMVIDVLDAGRIALRVVEPARGVVFSHWLRTE